MKFPTGSGIVLGTITGLILGILTNNIVSMAFLGLMFGVIGEAVNKPKKK